jgi:hypothetical protein
MSTRARLNRCLPALAAVLLLPAVAAAEEPGVITTANSSPWQISVTPYVWLPKISASVVTPITGTTESAQLNANDILNHLNFAGMLTFDVHYRQFGFFTDAMYMSLGANKSHFHSLTVGDQQIPVTTDAYINLNLKAYIVTYALEYRFVDSDLVTMDVLGGARYLELKTEVGYVLTGAIDNLPPATRTGSPTVSKNRTDAIGGFKGQFHLGEGWHIPAYVDIGGDMTWQAATGVAYQLKYGEVSALYRYLDYYVGHSGGGSLTVQGPMLGWTLRW